MTSPRQLVPLPERVRALLSDFFTAFHDSLLVSTAIAVRHLVQERSYSIIPLPVDNVFSTQLRRLRYASSLGRWYSLRVIPNLCRSLVAL
jgi:hypothetical protein